LPGSRASLGRNAANCACGDALAAFDNVSWDHAALEAGESGALFVTDLGSTNGTWILGRGQPTRLTPGERTALRSGDTIQLGNDPSTPNATIRIEQRIPRT